VNVPRSRSNRCADFQLKMSKMKVTGREKPPDNDKYLAHMFTYGWWTACWPAGSFAHFRMAAYMSAQGVHTCQPFRTWRNLYAFCFVLTLFRRLTLSQKLLISNNGNGNAVGAKTICVFRQEVSIVILAKGVLRSSKCTRIKYGWGFTPDPAG